MLLFLLINYFCVGLIKATGLMVFVQEPHRNALPIDLAPSATVADVHKESGLSPDYYQLNFGGMQLTDLAASLADLGVSSESLIDVQQIAIPITFMFTTQHGEEIASTPKSGGYRRDFDYRLNKTRYTALVRGQETHCRYPFKLDFIGHHVDFFEKAIQFLSDSSLISEQHNFYFCYAPSNVQFEKDQFSTADAEKFEINRHEYVTVLTRETEEEHINTRSVQREDVISDSTTSTSSVNINGTYVTIPDKQINDQVTMQQLIHWYPGKSIMFTGSRSRGGGGGGYIFYIFFDLPRGFTLSFQRMRRTRRLLNAM